MFFIKYLGALIYDAIIVFVLFFVITGIIILFNHNQALPPETRWYQFTLILLGLIYYYGSLKFGGQTMGMRAWRFKLSALTSNNLSRQHILRRILYFIPATIAAPFYLKSHYTLLNQWTKTHFELI